MASVTEIVWIVSNPGPGRPIETDDRDLARWFWVMGYQVRREMYTVYFRLYGRSSRRYPLKNGKKRYPKIRTPLDPEPALAKVFADREIDEETRSHFYDILERIRK